MNSIAFAKVKCRFLIGDGCWEWQGNLDNSGAGQVYNYKPGTWTAAYRVMYELFVGPIPEDKQLNHYCDNRACVRPDHLYVGTQADNMEDRNNRGRFRNQYSGQTHCKHGHEFTLENTYKKPGSGRDCKICRRARDAERRAKRKSPWL